MVAALLTLLVILFGWPMLRPIIAAKLSAAFRRTTTIGSLGRRGGTLLHPTLVLQDVHVLQPTWAGPGDIASVQTVVIELPLLPLLAGRVRPDSIAVTRLHLRLSRTSDGRLNWTDRTHPIGPPVLGNLSIADGQLDIIDAKSARKFTARFALDGLGFRLSGRGQLGQRPLRLTASGAPINPRRPAAPWRFRVALSSPRVRINLNGVADHSLDFDHFTAHLAARGKDLHDLDKVIEAGLPGTQPFVVHSEVRHDAPDWMLDRIAGTLG
ncbi:MAG: AsmA family protein, partial [Pseudomonadota bacterium]|nr:AsmA family protein [Pseudomonadota bacterium]